MAVYIDLSAAEFGEAIAAYDVGDFVSAEEIAEGISNSNWAIRTTQGRFVLTRYERRIEEGDLPFFLALLDYLAARDCPVPATVHDRSGAQIRTLSGKPSALIEFMPGLSPVPPTVDHARAAGAALAQVHLAARDFTVKRPNPLGIGATLATLERCGAALGTISPELTAAASTAADLAAAWPQGLPTSTVHTDLFPDNVLMVGNTVTGLIDFYFACYDAMAYDLAVTHAAWSFNHGGTEFAPSIGAALVLGYEQVRPLDSGEREALPVLAQGACLRFVASRSEDWLDHPGGTKVMRKDPLDFLRRQQFYASAGRSLFA